MTTNERFLLRFRASFNRAFGSPSAEHAFQNNKPYALMEEHYQSGMGMMVSSPWLKITIGNKTVTFNDNGDIVEEKCVGK